MFTVGDGCAKLTLAKRLSIRVLITRVWEPFFMPFCTAVGPCSQHMRDYWRWFISFWSIGPEVGDVYVISFADVRLISEKMFVRD